MSPAWYNFYRYLLGIPYSEFETMRYGEFLDIILCYQIHNGIAEPKTSTTEPLDEVMIP